MAHSHVTTLSPSGTYVEGAADLPQLRLLALLAGWCYPLEKWRPAVVHGHRLAPPLFSHVALPLRAREPVEPVALQPHGAISAFSVQIAGRALSASIPPARGSRHNVSTGRLSGVEYSSCRDRRPHSLARFGSESEGGWLIPGWCTLVCTMTRRSVAWRRVAERQFT